jgi:hypothetical protein
MQHLVQLLLPLRDNTGIFFPAALYEQIRHELTDRFGGMTAYVRAPAEGTFETGSGEIMRDEIVIVEVMCEQLEEDFWRGYRAQLTELFAQEDLIVRALPMRRL